jgi:phosphate-induced protein 1
MSRPMNALYRNTAFLCAAALILAACSENTTTPTPRGISPDASSQDVSPEMNNPQGHGIIFPTRDWFAHNSRPSGGGTNTGIQYHGGPVLQAGTNVAAVYWAGARIYNNAPAPGTHGAGSADGSLIGYFLTHLGGSPYFNINHSYTDGGGTQIVNSVTYTQYWANNTNVPADGQSVSDAQMIAMLQSGFDSGALTYDPSTLYAIFTAGTVNLGGGFGSQYCAYHWYSTVTVNHQPRTVLYAAMPYDAAYPTACTWESSPNGDFGADAEVNTLAHETEETTTDMLGTAWYDHRGYENADKCAWTFGATYTASNGQLANMNLDGKDFLVQRNWVNAGSGGCALSY